MRILFLSTEYPPETGGGGIGSYVACVSAALAARGHEVHVLSCAAGQAARDYQDGEVWVHRRGQVGIRGLGRLLRIPGTAWRANMALSCWWFYRQLGVSFDVVESPDWLAEGLVIALLRSKPLVAHLHTPGVLVTRFNGGVPGVDGTLASILERTVVRRAEVVTAPSLLVATTIAHEGWIEADRVRVIRYPIDRERWDGVQRTEPGERLVLQVGRIEHLKGPDVLLEAVRLLSQEIEDVQVAFVGRSSGHRGMAQYGDWLQAAARRSGASAIFVDQVDRSELAEWYARARVVAIPSRYDNFPMVGVEAMACGRPVVCTENTGLAEILGDSGGGAVVPVDDPKELASALAPFLLHEAQAAESGERARMVIHERCGPDGIAQERDQCYRDAIETWRTHRERAARGFPHAGVRCRRAAPDWWEWAAREAAQTPWKHFYLRTADQLLELIAMDQRYLDPQGLNGKRVLDVGCTPAVSAMLAALGASVVVLDLNPTELERAEEIVRALDLRIRIAALCGDAFHPPVAAGSCDVVWNSGFVEHFDDPVAIIRSMADLAKPGGLVCVLAPAPRTLHSAAIRPWLRRHGDYTWDEMGRERSYSATQLADMMATAGLRVVGTTGGNLRRSVLDDTVVLPHLQHGPFLPILWRLMNAVDWIESRTHHLRGFGFMAGAVGVVDQRC